MTAGRGTAVAIVAGAGLAFVVACAAGGRAYTGKPETVESAPPLLGARPDEIRAEISRLDREIETARGTTAAPDAEQTAAMADVAPEQAAMTCVRSGRDVCVDVCKLGDSICENAKSICDLAGQLPGDAWAADRCNAGKASCKTASEKCCGC